MLLDHQFSSSDSSALSMRSSRSFSAFCSHASVPTTDDGAEGKAYDQNPVYHKHTLVYVPRQMPVHHKNSPTF